MGPNSKRDGHPDVAMRRPRCSPCKCTYTTCRHATLGTWAPDVLAGLVERARAYLEIASLHTRARYCSAH